tara:strand:+ start:592 stop:798 length:207 start_codon:yes stop_codon:yes gene_type:complete
MHKLINGNKIQLTAEEIADREALAVLEANENSLLKQKETNAKTKKASGKQKLKDLGLDDDEIQALIGV